MAKVDKCEHDRMLGYCHECTATTPPVPDWVTQTNAEKAVDKQVGGNHYKDMKIQPIEFIMANDLNYCQANVVKYVCRYKKKNGKQDLEKAIHYLQLLIEEEYGS